MQHSEGTFISQDGLQLYYQSWCPDESARAVVVIVHGLGAHSGTFSNIIQALMPHQYAVYACDLRGHGRSPGQRGYVQTWAELRDDLNTFCQTVQSQHPGRPLFLYGHSLGAVVALDYALHHPRSLQGVIASALPIGVVGVSPLRMAVGRTLSLIWPRFTLDTGIKNAAGSRNPAVTMAYAQDALRHTKGTARLVTEFLTVAHILWLRASELNVPLLMLHGGADQVALPEGSRLFFERVTFPDKERFEYPGGYHDIHEDIDYEEVLADLVDWLERHLTVETPSALQYS